MAILEANLASSVFLTLKANKLVVGPNSAWIKGYPIVLGASIKQLDLLDVNMIQDYKYTESYFGFCTQTVAKTIGLPEMYFHIVHFAFTDAGYSAQLAISVWGFADMWVRNSTPEKWNSWRCVNPPVYQ